MEAIAQVTIALAWLAIAALLLWAIVDGSCKLLEDDGPLPLFALLERQGITLWQVEEVGGMREIARAVRRCAYCASRSRCSPDAACCPSEPLLRRVRNQERVS